MNAQVVVVMASWLVMRSEALGICYDPKHVPQVSRDSMQNDLKQIKNMGFSAIRTYTTLDDHLGDLALETGLDLAIGIPWIPATLEQELANAMRMVAASASTPGKVKVIFVGNENFITDKSVPPEMLQFIQRVKDQFPGIKVGTVQRQTEFLENNQRVNGMQELVEKLDVVGVNIHPYFTDKNGIDGFESLKVQWNTMKTLDDMYPTLSRKLQLTEVGWPTGGNEKYATPQDGLDFYQQYMEWSKSVPEEQYYFQAYDQPWRGQGSERQIEKFFGIIDETSNPKYPGVQVPGSSGQTTATDQQPPVPNQESTSPAATIGDGGQGAISEHEEVTENKVEAHEEESDGENANAIHDDSNEEPSE